MILIKDDSAFIYLTIPRMDDPLAKYIPMKRIILTNKELLSIVY
jgi:hypothetical protein